MLLWFAAELGGNFWQEFASLLRRNTVVGNYSICIIVIGLCSDRVDCHVLVTERNTTHLFNVLELEERLARLTFPAF